MPETPQWNPDAQQGVPDASGERFDAKQVKSETPSANTEKGHTNPLERVVTLGKNILTDVFVDKRFDVTQKQGYQNIVTKVQSIDHKLRGWEAKQNEKTNLISKRHKERLRQAINDFDK